VIDVSAFKIGDRCPSCTERRVYAVDIRRDLWRCVPNAVVRPWKLEQIIEHDAKDSLDPDEQRRLAAWEQVIQTGQVKP